MRICIRRAHKNNETRRTHTHTHIQTSGSANNINNHHMNGGAKKKMLYMRRLAYEDILPAFGNSAMTKTRTTVFSIVMCGIRLQDDEEKKNIKFEPYGAGKRRK